MTLARMLRLCVALSASVLGQVGTRASALEVAHRVRAPDRWIANDGADVVAEHVAGAVIWCVCAWLTVALTFTALAYLPGFIGNRCTRIGIALLPRAMQRMLGAGIGMSLALAPAAAASGNEPAHQVTTVGSHRQPAVGVISAPAVPNHRIQTLPSAPSVPLCPPQRPVSDRYRVRSGDSLWTIVQRRHRGATDARISTLLPAWYAANRKVIGRDPNILIPGQLLRAPQTDPFGDAR